MGVNYSITDTAGPLLELQVAAWWSARQLHSVVGTGHKLPNMLHCRSWTLFVAASSATWEISQTTQWLPAALLEVAIVVTGCQAVPADRCWSGCTPVGARP